MTPTEYNKSQQTLLIVLLSVNSIALISSVVQGDGNWPGYSSALVACVIAFLRGITIGHLNGIIVSLKKQVLDQLRRG